VECILEIWPIIGDILPITTTSGWINEAFLAEVAKQTNN
jgi:hypothetical protein